MTALALSKAKPHLMALSFMKKNASGPWVRIAAIAATVAAPRIPGWSEAFWLLARPTLTTAALLLGLALAFWRVSKATSPVARRLWHELRLTSGWGVWFWAFTAWLAHPGDGGRPEVELVSQPTAFMALALMAITVVTRSFTDEWRARTYLSWWVSPVKAKVVATKITVSAFFLAVMVAIVALQAPTWLPAVVALAALSLATGPFWALVVRSPMGSPSLTWFVPVALWALFGFMGWPGTALAVTLAVYGVSLAAVTPWVVKRVSVGFTFEPVRLPRFFSLPVEASYSPVRLLVLKELGLQRLTMMAVGALGVAWVAFRVLERDSDFSGAVLALGVMGLPMLIGYLGVGEELRLKSFAAALTAVRERTFWRVKWSVVFGLTTLASVVMPTLLMAEPPRSSEAYGLWVALTWFLCALGSMSAFAERDRPWSAKNLLVSLIAIVGAATLALGLLGSVSVRHVGRATVFGGSFESRWSGVFFGTSTGETVLQLLVVLSMVPFLRFVRGMVEGLAVPGRLRWASPRGQALVRAGLLCLVPIASWSVMLFVS